MNLDCQLYTGKIFDLDCQKQWIGQYPGNITQQKAIKLWWHWLWPVIIKPVSAVRQKILFPSNTSEQPEVAQNQILQNDSDDESDSEEENSKSETQDAVR